MESSVEELILEHLMAMFKADSEYFRTCTHVYLIKGVAEQLYYIWFKQ